MKRDGKRKIQRPAGAKQIKTNGMKNDRKRLSERERHPATHDIFIWKGPPDTASSALAGALPLVAAVYHTGCES